MNYKNKELCKIRTITTFLSLTNNKESWRDDIAKAADFCKGLSGEFQQHGYCVQSIRVVTNPFGEYINTSNLDMALADLKHLSDLLQASVSSGIRIRLAIGEARFPHEIMLVPELIKAFGDLCNVCVNVGADELGLLDDELIISSCEAIKEISDITPRGEGNFNFTVNFNCSPLIPYFPASYHHAALGKRFVIGLETPDLLVAVLKEVNSAKHDRTRNNLCKLYYQRMSEALQHHISMINTILADYKNESEFVFAGFDSSAAPSKNCASMTEVYELMGVEYFGAAGTVEISSLLTKVFKSIKGVDLVGFSGLMLALTEDMGLAKGSGQGDFDIRALLTYSAVCGIGLDTVPIPGDTSIEKIAALMRDTGTMAYRLDKPLTVRVFPVPGLKAGEMTAFESDDLCNCAVLAVP